MKIDAGEGVTININIEGAREVKAKEVTSEAWEGFDPESDNYPYELDLAMQAWRAVTMARDPRVALKEQIRLWLLEHYPQCSDGARDRISTVCNWGKGGGRPKQ